MRDDRAPHTPVAKGTFSPPVTRRSTRAAKKAHQGDGNVTPHRERACAAPEAASTAPTRGRSTDRGSAVTRKKGTSRDPSPSTPVTPRPVGASDQSDGRNGGRVDTPRPARDVQSAMYRDRNGVLRIASPEAARARDCPPTPSAAMPPPPPFPGARHGIRMSDGRRDGRVPKIADENVARIVDVFRLWVHVNAMAKDSTRLPWQEAFTLVAEKGFVQPAPASKEALKDRIKTVAKSVALRKGLEDVPSDPVAFCEMFGGAAEPPEWLGELDTTRFPLTTRLVLLLLDLILCPAGSSVSPSPRCVH